MDRSLWRVIIRSERTQQKNTKSIRRKESKGWICTADVWRGRLRFSINENRTASARSTFLWKHWSLDIFIIAALFMCSSLLALTDLFAGFEWCEPLKPWMILYTNCWAFNLKLDACQGQFYILTVCLHLKQDTTPNKTNIYNNKAED